MSHKIDEKADSAVVKCLKLPVTHLINYQSLFYDVTCVKVTRKLG